MQKWLGQVTTGAGFSALLGVLGAWATGQMPWQAAVPAAVAAIVAIAWPENAPAAAKTETMAKDIIDLLPLITAAMNHGAKQQTLTAEPTVAPALAVAPAVAK